MFKPLKRCIIVEKNTDKIVFHIVIFEMISLKAGDECKLKMHVTEKLIIL